MTVLRRESRCIARRAVLPLLARTHTQIHAAAAAAAAGSLSTQGLAAACLPPLFLLLFLPSLLSHKRLTNGRRAEKR